MLADVSANVVPVRRSPDTNMGRPAKKVSNKGSRGPPRCGTRRVIEIPRCRGGSGGNDVPVTLKIRNRLRESGTTVTASLVAKSVGTGVDPGLAVWSIWRRPAQSGGGAEYETTRRRLAGRSMSVFANGWRRPSESQESHRATALLIVACPGKTVDFPDRHYRQTGVSTCRRRCFLKREHPARTLAELQSCRGRVNNARATGYPRPPVFFGAGIPRLVQSFAGYGCAVR